jgi:hypothetical protein
MSSAAQQIFAQPVRGRRLPRERRRVSRMIGAWPEGIRFEDAKVPWEPFFRGAERAVPGIWPQSSLATGASIVRGR